MRAAAPRRSFSSALATKPRVTTSGLPTRVPFCLSTVTTTRNMPSLARARRSRSTMSPTSPTEIAVHVDVAGLDVLAAASRAVGQELDGLAVLEDEDVLRLQADVGGQAAVLHEHPELAVDGDDVLGLRQVEHELELFLAGVAGDVGTLDGVVEDVGAGLEEVVHGARHVLLVAGDGAGADDDRVARHDLDEAVVAVGHARQARHGLTLGAGRGDGEPMRRGCPGCGPWAPGPCLGGCR